MDFSHMPEAQDVKKESPFDKMSYMSSLSKTP